MDVAPLRCRRTLSEVLGPDPVFVAQPSFSGRDFLRRPGDEPFRDSWTANFLTVLGDLASVCSRGALTTAGGAVLAEAGLPHRPRAFEYRDALDYRALLRRLARAGRRLVLQHLHPTDEVPGPAYWIDRTLLSRLNDKADFPRLVPAAHVADRRLIRSSSVSRLKPTPSRPLVLKAATTWSSGAGAGVAIVRSARDLARAARRLAASRLVVVEPWLPFLRTVCLTYAGNGDGIEYLGAPEQIVDESGANQGSWFDDSPVPPEAVELGGGIMARAVTLGYRGIAGFDCGVLEDGRPVVFDLNFRLCGSTPGLLWFDAAAKRWSRPAARNVTLFGAAGFRTLLGIVRRALRNRWFLPLALFDGGTAPGPAVPVFARGLVFGATRAQAEARHARLVAALEAA